MTTSVIVNDRDTLVLGGLIQEELRDVEQRVPILGSIPILGSLFRADRTEVRKTNMMIFIKPTILRDSVATAYETNAKYQAIRNMQIAEVGTGRNLFPDLEPPVLPELKESRPEPIDLRTLQEYDAEVEPGGTVELPAADGDE